jgi:hypothetical protein
MSDDGFSMKFEATLKSVELRADWLIPALLRRARAIFENGQGAEHEDNCRERELLDRLMQVVTGKG